MKSSRVGGGGGAYWSSYSSIGPPLLLLLLLMLLILFSSPHDSETYERVLLNYTRITFDFLHFIADRFRVCVCAYIYVGIEDAGR